MQLMALGNVHASSKDPKIIILNSFTLYFLEVANKQTSRQGLLLPWYSKLGFYVRAGSKVKTTLQTLFFLLVA
jgi:hypothetical protein